MWSYTFIVQDSHAAASVFSQLQMAWAILQTRPGTASFFAPSPAPPKHFSSLTSCVHVLRRFACARLEAGCSFAPSPVEQLEVSGLGMEIRALLGIPDRKICRSGVTVVSANSFLYHSKSDLNMPEFDSFVGRFFAHLSSKKQLCRKNALRCGKEQRTA